MQHKINFCYGCMEPSNGEPVCPLCGYSVYAPHFPDYLAPGSELAERYIVGKMLSHNGESAVYIGYDNNLGQKVFIREYFPDTLCKRVKDSSVVCVNQNMIAQYKTFMSEFVELNKTLAKLRNVNHINPATDMFGDNNTGYVVFNYIEKKSLEEYLEENASTLLWSEVKRNFPPIFTTLSLIHNAGLIHRGLCPENLSITSDNEIYLDNFCVADERTAGTELNSEIYDGYAAPEQYNSGKWQGTWTDVYGISALLYRILTGITPISAFERETNDELKSPHEINPDIPEKVSDAIMSGMALDKDKRIQTITELVTRLFENSEKTRIDPVIITKTIPAVNHDENTGRQESRSYSKENHGNAEYRNEKSSSRKTNSLSKNSKKKAPAKSKVFLLVAIATAVILIALLAVVMIALDDTSTSVADNVSLTEAEDTQSLPDIDELADSLTYQTTAPEETTQSNQPTLNEVENNTESESDEETQSVYIMNDIVGKNYDTIKNSPTYESLNFVPEYEFSEEIAKGVIISQSVEKGETYYEGEDVVIKISLGSRYVAVPDYVGMKAKDYFDLLDSKNIKYEEISYETEEYADGYVCGISAENETLDLESGETLIVYVAYNPTPVTTTAAAAETTTEETTTTTEEEPVIETEEEEEENTETTYDDEEYIEEDITIDDPEYEEENAEEVEIAE